MDGHWTKVLEFTDVEIEIGITESNIHAAHRLVANRRSASRDAAVMAELNAARDQALKEIGACRRPSTKTASPAASR